MTDKESAPLTVKSAQIKTQQDILSAGIENKGFCIFDRTDYLRHMQKHG